MRLSLKFSLVLFSITFLFNSCKKDAASNAKNFSGVYVGNVTRFEPNINKSTVINNCTIIITSTDNTGQVTVATDKIFYYTLIGNVSASNLTLTPKEFNNSTSIISKLYGTASFNGNTMNIDFKQDDNQNGNLYYQIKWSGTLTK